MTRLRALLLATCLAVPAVSAAQAEMPGNRVKIGVLTDMSGPFSDQVGAGSVAAARLAAEDFAKESTGSRWRSSSPTTRTSRISAPASRGNGSTRTGWTRSSTCRTPASRSRWSPSRMTGTAWRSPRVR